MQDFIGKKVLLGICGGVAAYKSAYLVRELTKLGASVQVVMTESAKEFISPMTMQALSGQAVRISLFDENAERAMGHIELARWADYLVIAPATANCMAKMANGLADDLLSTLYLVADVPTFVCPAMNQSMWSHPATQENYARLKARGVIFVGPECGEQACGEHGFGRLIDGVHIINALRVYEVHQSLPGKRVVITAGPTREAIDSVRYLSNRSSGKMGYALAYAAHMAGAEVTLISGPSTLTLPNNMTIVYAESAQSMYEAVMASLKPGSIFIGAAAVADYSIASPALEKMKKQDELGLSLELSQTKDIIAEVVKSGLASYVVGFAAETQQLEAHARDKLARKKLDMIVANLVGQGIGFDVDTNEVLLMSAKHCVALPAMHKMRLAAKIIEMLAVNLHNVG